MSTWTESLDRLKAGNQRYVSESQTNPNNSAQRRGEQTDGQQPFAIILSCADSRVVPELVFDCGIGDIFIVRVAGNVANLSSIASIEYAVAHLGSKLIVVMGHESCGAVTAAIQGGDSTEALNHLLGHINPAILASEDKEVETVVRVNAQIVAKHLAQNSKTLSNAVESGDVKIVSAYYYLGSGEVEFL